MNKELFVSVCHVHYVITGNILMYMCEVQSVFTMECDLAYKDLEGLFPFHNMHKENVHRGQFSKICLSRLLKNSAQI
jgi:hypothetical protein